MKTLVAVEGQTLRWYGKIPEIADNSVQFVQLEFDLPWYWADLVVVAQFSQTKTYNKLLEDGCCYLPAELVAGPCEVSLFGQRAGETVRATSVPLRFKIKRSGFTSTAETPIPPTPDLYAQLLEKLGHQGPSESVAIEDDGGGNVSFASGFEGDGEDHELNSLNTGKTVYTSFPDKVAREGLKGKLANPGGLTPGKMLRVKSVDQDGSILLEGVDMPSEGSSVVIDATLTQPGQAADAKATGDAISKLSQQNQDYDALTNKPRINGVTLEGNKTAEELGIGQPTNEQVSTAVNDFLTKKPVAPGATPEQVAQIEFANATDEALFATLEAGSLYEVDLSGWAWMDGKVLHYNASSGSWGSHYDGCPGHHYSSGGYIHLFAGDTLITNADSHTAWANGQCTVLRTVTQTAYGWTGNGSPLMYGRGEFDGLYRIYTATEEVRVGVAYQYDVDYDVHFYVARRRSGDGEPVPFRYSAGYIKFNTGEAFIGHETQQFLTGYQDNVVSELLTIRAPGKFLLVDNAVYPVGEKGGVVWVRLDADGGLIQQMTSGRWPGNKSYYIIPLWNDTEYVRFAFKFTAHPAQYTTAIIVDAEYLVRHGYAEHVIGKSIAMFGDSYVAGHSAGNINTWHYMFAERNQMQYTNLGTNGIGLCWSPNLGNVGLIDKVDTLVDADYIGVICGRNDYSTQVPIGTNDDMVTAETQFGARTFKGGLNYLCQYLVEHFPGKKVFFLTPWFFPSRTDITETHKPQEYIDAILEITGLWGIPCFDAARRSGIHVRSEAFRGQYFLAADDVSHLNVEGAKLMMDNITGWMLAL